MKNKNVYEAPEIELINLVVEENFALSVTPIGDGFSDEW